VSIADIKKQATDKMAKSVETLRVNLTHVRTGRAHVGLIDHLKVDYYGSDVPINQVASISLSDARTIAIQPFEKKMIQVVEKAIRDSDLGVNPATTGDVVRVPMPALTEERRRELAKIVKHEGENSKVAVRNIRRDAMTHVKQLLKDGEVSEDEDKRAEKEIQQLTDKSIAEIDRIVAEKEKDLMAV
jgi:ribosome recycling factor